MVPWSSYRRGRRAFTLLEVLVVVSVIALLIAILMPSLAKAREQARSAQCLSNLKQMGTSTVMYTVDNRSYLPGPLHPAIYRNTYDAFYRSQDADGPTSRDWNADTYFRRTQLVYFISRYYSEKGKAATMADKIATCPTADLLQNKNVKNIVGTGPAYQSRRPFHYVANSVKADKMVSGPNRPSSGPPYTGTKVPLYFGLRWPNWTNRDYYSDTMSINSKTTLKQRMPKQIDVIRQGSREWAYADVWYSTVGLSNNQLAGPWPYFEGKESSLGPGMSSISMTDPKTKSVNFVVPTYPYHSTIRTWPSSTQFVAETKTKSHARFAEGRTNSAFFDGHAEALRTWQGTVNPCWYGDSSCGN